MRKLRLSVHCKLYFLFSFHVKLEADDEGTAGGRSMECCGRPPHCSRATAIFKVGRRQPIWWTAMIVFKHVNYWIVHTTLWPSCVSFHVFHSLRSPWKSCCCALDNVILQLNNACILCKTYSYIFILHWLAARKSECFISMNSLVSQRFSTFQLASCILYLLNL